MKKIISALFLVAVFTACNESGVSVEGKIDSLDEKLDTLGQKIERKAEQVWDTTKERAGDLKDKVEQKWDSSRLNNNRKDSVNK
jgi:hypothetical protein